MTIELINIKSVVLSIFVVLLVYGLKSQSIAQNLNSTSCRVKDTAHKGNFVLDTQDSFTQIGQWGWGQCGTVVTKGKYAFIGNGILFQVLDISNPDSLKVIGEISPVYGGVIAISGNYAYVAGGGLSIIDISDPTKPVVKSFTRIGIPGLTAITIAKNYAIVGNVTGAVIIVDVSNILSPKILGSTAASGWVPRSIVTVGNHMFVTSYGETVDDFDISNPYYPVRLGDYLFGRASSALTLYGNYLLVGVYQWFVIFDASNPDSLKLVSSVKIPTGNNAPFDITVRDSLAYVTLDTAGIAIVNISNISNPKLIKHIPYPYGVKNWEQFLGPVQISVDSNSIYIACENGLWSVEMDSMNVKKNSFFYTAGSPMKMTTDSANHIFAAENCFGLKIVDFADPSKPRLIGEYQPDEAVNDVAVSNNKAYLLCDTDMQVLDVSNLAKPVLIGKVAFGDSLKVDYSEYTYGCLILSGSTVYAGRNSKRLYAIDVSNPAKPQIKSFYTLSGKPSAIFKYQNYIYIANALQGIQIINISDPNNLNDSVFLKVTDLTGISIFNNKLFITNSTGFSEYELINPVNPILKYNIKLSTVNPAEIKCDKNYAYIVDLRNFSVVDISNPDSGKIVSIRDNSTAHDEYSACLSVFNNEVILGTLQSGIIFLRNNRVTGTGNINNLEAPGNFILIQNYPNPFNPATTISYEIPNSGFVTLRIYDILGREVKTLINERQSAGVHEVNFNARNFSSGVYLYVITTDGESLVKKMVILK